MAKGVTIRDRQLGHMGTNPKNSMGKTPNTATNNPGRAATANMGKSGFAGNAAQPASNARHVKSASK